MSLLKAAMEKYDRERSVVEGIPLYALDYHDQPNLRGFVASNQSGLRNPHLITLTVVSVEKAHQDESTAIAEAITCDIVVTSLEPVWVPDEDNTTAEEVKYWSDPDWRGEGYVLNYNFPAACYEVVNRVRFFAETGGHGNFASGNLQFLDHQPA